MTAADSDPSNGSSERLLEVTDLMTEFPVYRGRVMAVAGVSFHVRHKEVVGPIGETGCGKSVAALPVMRLIRPPGRIVGGKIRFLKVDILSLPDSAMRRIRGKGMSMVFQRKMSSLDTVFTLGRQFGDLIRFHCRAARGEAPASPSPAWNRLLSLIRRVCCADTLTNSVGRCSSAP